MYISSTEEKSWKKYCEMNRTYPSYGIWLYHFNFKFFNIYRNNMHQTQTNTVYRIGRSKAIFISAPANVYSSLEIQSTSGIYAIEHGFLRVLRFLPPIKLVAMIYLKYCWQWRLSTITHKPMLLNTKGR
jgi:hypothetical protein